MTIRLLQCRFGSHYLPQRYIMCFMTFWGLLMSYGTRNCVNIAITKIVKPVIHNNTHINTSSTSNKCPNNNPPAPQIKGGEYDWSENDQALVLTGFFYGYALCHVPAGVLSDHFGGKHVLATGVAISGIGSILFPLSVHLTSGNIWPPTILRFIMGMAQSPLFPAATTLTGLWAPQGERSTIGSIILTGSQIGSILGNYLTPLLISSFGTWMLPFYFWGFVSLVWYVLYIFICYSEPAKCPFITKEEADYLASEIGPSRRMKIPWCKILSSAPVWAIVAPSIGHDMMFYFMSVDYPKYLSEALQYTLDEVGIYSSTPYITLWMVSNISALFCDYLIRHEILKIVHARKIFCTIGSIFPAIFLILIVYMYCNRNAAVVFAFLCLTTMGPYYPGLRVNPVDITKNFAGIVMAVSNGVGVFIFIPIPQLAGLLVKEHTPQEWIPLFWVMSISAVLLNFVFLIWGAAERQEWDTEIPS